VSRGRSVIVWGAVVLAGLTGSLPRAAGQATLKVETHLIDTTVSVHDAEGGNVKDLTADDLAIVEDGIPQTIRFFSRAEQLPLSVSLVIDESGSQDKFVKQHEQDIAEFLRQTIEPQDQAFAICFGNKLRLVSDWSNSGAAIVDGIRRFDKGDRTFPEIGPKEDRDLGTALNDAVFYAIHDRMSGIHQRRKVLLVFSDGEENSSEHDLLDVVQAAQEEDVLVYAIRYTENKGSKINARDRYGIRELDHLTAQTGGKSYDARAMKVSQAFAEIAGDLRSLFGVAYQSTNRVRDGAYRKVVIQSKRPGLTVRARAGYYAR